MGEYAVRRRGECTAGRRVPGHSARARPARPRAARSRRGQRRRRRPASLPPPLCHSEMELAYMVYEFQYVRATPNKINVQIESHFGAEKTPLTATGRAIVGLGERRRPLTCSQTSNRNERKTSRPLRRMQAGCQEITGVLRRHTRANRSANLRLFPRDRHLKHLLRLQPPADAHRGPATRTPAFSQPQLGWLLGGY